MGSKRIPQEIKEEALGKVRSGKTVQQVAQEHGINPKNIYNWLNRSADGADRDVLEISRLRRENEALMKLVGRITYEQELAKKNWSHKHILTDSV